MRRVGFPNRLMGDLVAYEIALHLFKVGDISSRQDHRARLGRQVSWRALTSGVYRLGEGCTAREIVSDDHVVPTRGAASGVRTRRLRLA